jgi:hypothetical protein
MKVIPFTTNTHTHTHTHAHTYTHIQIPRNKLNQGSEMKIIKHCRNTLKKAQKGEKTSHVHDIGEIILLKCSY